MTYQEGSSAEQPTVDREHPYLGLQAFHERESAFFYGRDSEILDIFRLVRRDVLTVLFGMSGLGKTSLLNAGLFPRLREKMYLPVPIRLDFGSRAPDFIFQVKARVGKAVGSHCVDTPLPPEQETLWEYFHRTRFWDQQNRLLTPILVFDQFEELFTLGRRDDRITPFLQELADVIENHIPAAVRARMEESSEELQFNYGQPRAKVIFSLREDYLAHLEELVRLIPSLSRNRYRLTHMDGARAHEAVFKPGEHLLTHEVAQDIVRFAAGASEQPGLKELEVEPALLSLVCRELNSRRLDSGLPHITSKLLSGSKDRIIADFYENSVAGLDPGVRVFIEDHLLTASGFRSTKALDDALQLTGVSKPAIDTLVNKRLVRMEDRLGIQHVELIHDVLAGVIQESRQRRHQREAVREREHRAQQRRRKNFLQALGFAGVVCIVLAVVAVYLWLDAEVARQDAEVARQDAEVARQDAEVARQDAQASEGVAQLALLDAESRELSQASTMYIELDPMLSLILARAANTKGSTSQALGALHNATIASQLRRNLHQHKGSVQDVAYSPDGKWVATASADKTAKLWEVETGEVHYTFEGHDGAVTAVAFSPDGKWIATASIDKTARLWDVETGEMHYSLKGHKDRVTAVSFNHDGKRVATASTDKTSKLWDTETGELQHTLKGHSRAVTAVAFSPKGQFLATASKDRSARLWDTDTGVEKSVYKRTGVDKSAYESGVSRYGRKRKKDVNDVTFSPDEKWLATVSPGKSAKLWDTETGEPHHTLKGHESVVTAVAFSPDGTHVATADNDGAVLLFDTKSGTKQHLFKAYTSPVSEVAFSPDGSRLAIASGRSVQVWDAEQKSLMFRLVGHTGNINALSFSPDGKRLVTAGRDNSAKLWNVTHTEELPTLIGHTDKIRAVVFSPDGQWLASASDDRTIKLWDTRTDQIKYTLSDHKDTVNAVAFSPDGQWLATGSDDKTARLWDTETGELQHTLKGHSRAVTAVAFGPKGQFLATASKDGSARLWDTDTGVEKSVYESGVSRYGRKRKKDVNDVTFSPDGRSLATANEDGTVRLWDLKSGRETRSFDTSLTSRPVYAVTFSPNGNKIAAAAGTRAMIWDLTTTEETEPLVLRGISRRLSDIAFSPDGASLATARSDESVKLWDTNSGGLRFTLLGHTDAVTSVAFSSDGKQLATGSHDTTVHRYALDIDLLTSLSDDRVARRLTEEECLERAHLDKCKAVRLIQRGRKLASSEQIKLATQEFHKARKMDPEWEFEGQPDANHYARFLAGKALQAEARHMIYKGDASSAISMLERAKNSYNPDIEVDAQEIKTRAARVLERTSKTLARKGDASGAYKAVVKASDLNPGRSARLKTEIAKQLVRTGKRLAGQGDPDGAREALKTAKILDPDADADVKIEVAKAMETRGKRQLETGNSVEALQSFRKALELDPNIALNPEEAVANGLVKKGKRAAQSGNTDEASGIFSNALKLYPSLDLDPEVELANGLVTYGKRVAQSGNTDEASKIFSNALKLYPNLVLDPEVELANGLVTHGKRRARTGDIDAASRAFQKAQELDPTLVLDTKAAIAEALIQKGRGDANNGRIKEAITAYDQAQKTGSGYEITAKDWNLLCWFGTLWGQAHEVIQACNRAVALEEKNVGYRDSRGLARAVTGDVAGAIKDFEYYVEKGPQQKRSKILTRKREHWIAELESIRNPFTPSVLKALRSESRFF